MKDDLLLVMTLFQALLIIGLLNGFFTNGFDPPDF